ncbi:MAG: hypothetical protein ACI91R_002420 [Vicingaceae bacterium]|jgi:hypothetical protein
MKKTATLLLMILSLSASTFGQYYFQLYNTPGQNPNGLNIDDEFPFGQGLAAGWVSILGPSVATPAWSSNQTIPFAFNFDASPVTQYKVSSTGVLTYTTNATTVPSATKAALPSASIPDKSVCIWGIQANGTNDRIVTKTFGTAPNRQHWVFFTSHSLNGGWSYWSIVMEETTDKIYIVDQRHSGTNGGVSMGIQMTSTTAETVGANVLPLAGTNSASSDNAYYEFTQGVLPAVDAEMLSLETPLYLISGSNSIDGHIENKGSSAITSFDLNYSINNGTTVTQSVSGLNVASFTEYTYSHSTPWTSSSVGTFTVKSWISNVNGLGQDADSTNDEVQKTINVRDPIPNIVPSYTSTSNTFTYSIVSNSSSQLVSPTDLDFHPNGDLWVVNQETVTTGGSTVKFTNPSLTNQTSLRQIDGNAWHFMSLPTALAFSDNGNFATSTGVYDANHNGGAPFTGPALWSSDPAIYAQPSGGNGSHLDMLHASPYSMGIAHETGNAFWVFDGNSNDIVRYDFAADHGPGNASHDDGRIRRFTQPSVSWINANIPSHLVLDKSSNWLYIADGGNGRVLRLDITTGTVGGTPSFPQYEPLAEYTNVSGATWQIVADTGLVQPSGIDVIGNNMIVSDFSTGDIFIYDISTVPATRVGRLQTNTPGVTGVVFGPNGNIWYTNRTQNTVVKIIPSQVITNLNEVANESDLLIYPNPSNGKFSIETSSLLSNNALISVVDMAGREVYQNSNLSNFKNTINLSELSNGVYFLNLRTSTSSTIKKITISH